MSGFMMVDLRSRAVVVVMASVLVVPTFVACGARTPLDAEEVLDAGTDVSVDARADRDGDAGDADAGDTNVPDASPDISADASSDVTGPDAGQALVLSCVGVTQDRVQPADQGLTPDGKPDGQLTATGAGPFDALILATVDANGSPAFGQQWDTLIGQDPIPPGFSFSTGAQTWILGVWENGVRANDNQGRIALPAGPHALILFASSSGFFNAGRLYRLYGRTKGVWISSNVALWP